MIWSDWIFLIAPILIGLLPAAFVAKKGIRCGKKPKWQPPPWVFSVVWPILYILLGIQGMILWKTSGRQLMNKMVLIWITLTSLLLAWWPLFSWLVCSPISAFVSLSIITVLCWYTVIICRHLYNIPLVFWLSFATILSAQAI